MLRCVVVLGLFLSIACDARKSKIDDPPVVATTKRFKCYKVPLNGGSFRECAPALSQCEKLGCFERDEAYCFPYVLSAFGDQPEQRATMCAASARECEDWHADREHLVDHPLGPCIAMKVDEYVQTK